MYLYNSQSERIEDFHPSEPQVTVYVCGITPYDTTHLGHAFTYAMMDSFIRYLEYQGHTVRYVQNVTDIDDDILRQAGKVGEDWRQLGNHWTAHFIEDMKALNIRPPDYFPRATEAIPEIIEAIQALIDAGVAYIAGGSVYYAVKAFSGYGKLSHLAPEQMLATANERGNDPDDPHKHSALDFVLWQAHKPGEPAWESPWGPGRPGWHIECSTLVTRYLGDQIDVHGGGSDLVFPHHESEIAQVEPVTQRKPYVRLWLHTAMVRYQGEKMSKSLGNLVMVSDLLNRYTPDALRVCLANHHYREAWEYHEDDLRRASELAGGLRVAAVAPSGDGAVLPSEDLQHAFHEAMEHDLDTPAAVSVLGSLAERIRQNVALEADVGNAQVALRSMSGVLGLRLDAPAPDEWVTTGWNMHVRQFAPLPNL